MNSSPKKPTLIHTRISEVWIDDRDIVHTRYSEPNTDATIDDAIEYWEVASGLFRHEKNLLISHMKNLRSASRETREFFKRREVSERVLAIAMIVDSIINRVMGNIFIHFTRPPYPTRIFTTEDEAIEWLLSFVDEDRS